MRPRAWPCSPCPRSSRRTAGQEAQPPVASYHQVLGCDSGAIVHAETQRRGVLDVAWLTNYDVDVRIRIARVVVVPLQRTGRSFPYRDRAGGPPLVFDDIEE